MLRRIWNAILLVRRSLQQHALSTSITALSIALGTGLVLSVFSINDQTLRAFTGGSAGFDAVLGARGSPLQLVLNSVYHLETSPGNIPWKLYQQVQKDRRVKLAIPYAVGDNYRGFRVVGTNEKLFQKFEYRKEQRFQVEKGGRFFDPTLREAVVGSLVAQKTGLQLGSRFQPYHGLDFIESEQHEEEYVVVGILSPTNSPSDRVVWIPIEGVFRMSGHVLRGSGSNYQARPGTEIPDEEKEVSAVLLQFHSPAGGVFFDHTINRQGKVATLAWPVDRVLMEFFSKIGWIHQIMQMMAYLVMVVASASVLASLYNTMNERRREFAILRALGARRATVFGIIVLEAGTIAFIGSLLGFVVYGVIFTVSAEVIRNQTGMVLDLFAFHPVLVLAPLCMILLGALSGLLPAFKAYSTDVASNLIPSA
ncbi:MAG: ABC transporter permease [Planctomycetota bacterium]|jgi:putative ABC transport system permease protein|nr:ABC transporter permease [Planctomycetota bacterium]